MKKSWSPQYKSRFYMNPVFWIIGVIVVFIICLVLYCITKETLSFGGLPLYAGYCYCAYLEKKRWDVDGYSVITIDSGSRMIIFDNKIRIPFHTIADVSLHVEEPPEKIWLMQSRRLTVDVKDFNGFFEFNLKSGDKITFPVQFRNEAADIIETLRDNGFAIFMSDSDKYDVTGMYEIAYFLIFLGPVVLWFLWKMFLR